jgi:hypothetical protein
VPRIVTHVATIESGPGGSIGTPAKTVWVTLTVEEAEDLFEALRFWRAEVKEGLLRDGWHAHVTDSHGNELTIEITPFGNGPAQTG